MDNTTRQHRFMITHRLNDAAMAMQAQNYSGEAGDWHLSRVRASIAQALVPEAEFETAEEWLVDTIATCITDSTDIDCTSESQARYIVNELFKHLKPEDV